MRILFICLGFISLGLGLLGIALPVLPTTPFLLLASFCFAKGSKRFHDWFVSTRIYKKYLENFVAHRSMTLKNKLSILIPVSLMLIATFIFVDKLVVRIILSVLFVGKYLYFFTQIRTISDEEGRRLEELNSQKDLNNQYKNEELNNQS